MGNRARNVLIVLALVLGVIWIGEMRACRAPGLLAPGSGELTSERSESDPPPDPTTARDDYWQGDRICPERGALLRL